MPEVEMFKKWLQYDVETGKIYWLKNRSSRVRAGQEAGTLVCGYIRITVEGKRYGAHCIAWALHYGVWPSKELDHKDLNRANNRISNLREATKSQNLFNRNLPKNNTSGYVGVYFHKSTQKWVAQIAINKRPKNLGHFATIEEAIATRTAAALKFQPEFARIA